MSRGGSNHAGGQRTISAALVGCVDACTRCPLRVDGILGIYLASLRMNSEPRGALSVLLLALLTRRRAHGYALIAELRRRGGPALEFPEGSVYPVLQQLERKRLVRSNREIVDGRTRRVYEATEQGEVFYAEQRDSWLDYLKAMRTILEGECGCSRS